MVGGKRCIVESDVQRLFDRVRLCVWRGSCPGDLNYSRKGEYLFIDILFIDRVDFSLIR